MARKIEELENDIRSLSKDDRKHILRDLIADLDEISEPEIDEAWLIEAKRRHAEMKNGLVEPIPADKVFEQARNRIKK